MATGNSGGCIEEYLLVWPTSVPDKVAELFTKVFEKLPEMITYVSKERKKTDAFHLTIPLDLLEDLLKNDVYKLKELKHIDVIHNTTSESKYIKYRFNFNCEKVQFCTVYDLIRPSEMIECDETVGSTGSIDRNTVKAIVSLIEDRVNTKRMVIPAHLPSILQGTATTIFYGLPAKNTNETVSNLMCPSCMLVYDQFCPLKCGHQQCKICVAIRINCGTCSKLVLLDPNLQMKIQDSPVHCSGCTWIGSFKDYQVHIKQNHYELITCLIGSKQDDESSFHQQYLVEKNQVNLPNYHSTLDSMVPVKSLNGECIWIIRNVVDLKKYTTTDEQKSIYSCPFYTSPTGYKICARLYINGDRRARDTHMSLFVAIMRGEYDEKLQWPFKYKVAFTLIDQLATNDVQRHINEDFWPNVRELCSGRPALDTNEFNGIPMFFRLDVFEKDQTRYVQNDTMFIKITVDHLTERPSLPLLTRSGELPDEEDGDTTGENLMSMICESHNTSKPK